MTGRKPTLLELDEEYLKAHDFMERFRLQKRYDEHGNYPVSNADMGFISSRLCKERKIKVKREDQTYVLFRSRRGKTHYYDGKINLYPLSILHEAYQLALDGYMKPFRFSTIAGYLKDKPMIKKENFEKILDAYVKENKVRLKKETREVETSMGFRCVFDCYVYPKYALDAVYAHPGVSESPIT